MFTTCISDGSVFLCDVASASSEDATAGMDAGRMHDAGSPQGTRAAAAGRPAARQHTGALNWWTDGSEHTDWLPRRWWGADWLRRHRERALTGQGRMFIRPDGVYCDK